MYLKVRHILLIISLSFSGQLFADPSAEVDSLVENVNSGRVTERNVRFLVKDLAKDISNVWFSLTDIEQASLAAALKTHRVNMEGAIVQLRRGNTRQKPSDQAIRLDVAAGDIAIRLRDGNYLDKSNLGYEVWRELAGACEVFGSTIRKNILQQMK